MKNIVFYFFLCLLSLQSIIAQTDSLAVVNIVLTDTLPKETLWTRLKYDAASTGRGFVYAYSRPLHWEKQDYLIVGATAIGTGLLYLTDKETNEYFTKQEHDIPQNVQDFGYYFGKPLTKYGLTGSIYIYGLLTDNEKVRHTGVLMFTSGTVGGLLQQALKTAAGRARPHTGVGSNHFKPFEGSPAYSSFPSGHTVLSVTMVYALSKQFQSPWIKAGLFTVGSITPLSRLWAGAHWASDVLLSTVMSVAIVESVDSYLKKEKRYQLNPDPIASKKISWKLRAGYNQMGVVGTF